MSAAGAGNQDSLTHLERNFIFYGSYHNDPVNQLIHMFFVWPILLSALLLLSYAPAITTINGYDVGVMQIMTVYYAAFYAVIELPGFAGIIASALVVTSHQAAYYLRDQVLEGNAFQVALVIQIVSWAAQIYGHAFHEGRSPAFLTNVHHALVMAPLFVLMEFLFHFGYRENFRIKCQRHIDKNIKDYKQKLQKREDRFLR